MSQQGLYWLLTIPFAMWSPPSDCPDELHYLRGQHEIGEGGFSHWQILVAFKKKTRLRGVKAIFGQQCHAELARSSAAVDYVWKEDTRVDGSQFEFGRLAFKRNSRTDWDAVRALALAGSFNDIPADVYIRYYGNVRRIFADHARPVAMVRTCKAFIGPTGTGKSKLAWEQAGEDAYVKNPTTKWFDGYSGQRNVILDEFRGDINISHLLRWLDRYPVTVEIKGSSMPLAATSFWICSNLSVREWYPLIDDATMDALMRRIEVINF